MAKPRSFPGNCLQNTEVIKSVKTHNNEYCIVEEVSHDAVQADLELVIL